MRQAGQAAHVGVLAAGGPGRAGCGEGSGVPGGRGGKGRRGAQGRVGQAAAHGWEPVQGREVAREEGFCMGGAGGGRGPRAR